MGRWKKTIKKEKEEKTESVMLWAFLTPPILVSLVSLFHTQDFMSHIFGELPSWPLSLAYEVLLVVLIIVGPKMRTIGWGAAAWCHVITVILTLILAFANIYAGWVHIEEFFVNNVHELTWNTATKQAIVYLTGSLITVLSMSLIPMYFSYKQRKEHD